MSVNVYDPNQVSNRKLLQLVLNAAAEAGVSGSGLVISAVSGGRDLTLYRGALIARLEGLIPPFLPNQKVVLSSRLCNADDYRDPPILDIENGEHQFTVKTVYLVERHREENCWLIELNEKNTGRPGYSYFPLYPAKSFRLVTHEEPALTT